MPAKPISYKNKTYKSIKQLANEQNIDYEILKYQLRKNQSVEQTLKKSIQQTHNTIIYNNKTYKSVKQLANKQNMDYPTIKQRLQKGWSVEEAIETPIRPRPPKGFKIIKSTYTHNNIDYYECLHDNQKYILSIQEMRNFTEKTNGTTNKNNNV